MSWTLLPDSPASESDRRFIPAALNRLNHGLDALVRPEVRLFGHGLPMYAVCGYNGVILAVAGSMILVISQALALWVLMIILAAAICTFYAVAMLTKKITGEEKLIYYYHEMAVLAVTALLLLALGQPVLAYLDIAAMGIGLFLACGRIGCLMGGCCHGRPGPWGVRYRIEHAMAGFPAYFVGVRFFPVQALESLYVLGVVSVGFIMILRGAPHGAALVWYVTSYGLGRFGFEFLRGDSGRPFYRGFSEPQWITLLLMCLTVGEELYGVLPLYLWHLQATACVALTMIAVAVWREVRDSAKHRVLHPDHVKEVAEVIGLANYLADEAAPASPWPVTPLGRTSLGIEIFAGKTRSPEGDVYRYALSSRDGRMSEETARIVARLIRQLKRESSWTEFYSPSSTGRSRTNDRYSSRS